jgi:hypothetical protein
MSAIQIASLFAELKLSDKMTSPLKDAKKSLDGAAGSASQAERSVGGLGSAMQSLGGVIASIGVVGFFSSAIAGAREAAQVNRQLDAVLESTSTSVIKVRDAHGKLVPMMKATRESVLATSEALMKKTGIDDDEITKAQSLLLTFTKIGKDVMPMATEAVLDMAAAMGTDSKSAALMVGKALQSAEGVTALTRAGVSFTKQEQQKIKALFASGKAAEAQAMILAELNKEFGGSAAAQADGITRLQTGWGNFVETIGGVVLPIIDSIALVFNDLLTTLTPFIPQIAAVVASFAAFATVTGPIGAILGTILGPIGAIGLAVVALFAAWNTNFLGVQDIVMRFVGLFGDAFATIQDGLESFVKVLSGGTHTEDMMGHMVEVTESSDFGQRLKNAFLAAAPDILEGIAQIFQGLSRWLTEIAPGIIESGMIQAFQFASDVNAWIQANAPNIIWGVMSWLEGARDWLAENGPRLISEGVQGAINFTASIVQFISDNAPDLAFAIGGWIGNAVDWLLVEAPILIQNAISGLFTGVSVDGSGLMTALGTVFAADGPIWALFDGLFGKDKGTVGLKVKEFFGEGGGLSLIIEESGIILQGLWDKLFGKEGGLMITINALKGLVEAVFTAMRTSVINILKGLLAPLITLLKAVAIVADAVGNTELRALAGKAALDIEGMRAGGGDVRKGKNYIVGEKGPEILTAPFNGSIITNSAAFGGSGGNTININGMVLNGVNNPAVMFDQIEAEAQRRNYAARSRA